MHFLSRYKRRQSAFTHSCALCMLPASAGLTSKCATVERYNPVDGTWSVCAHMLSPRENAGCAVYLGHIYVGGGRDELNLELCAIERLSPETMRWTPVKRMRNKRDNVSHSDGVRPHC